ncbi:MAG TPA: hypothetical protein VFI25_14690 [Planctomycetota bacterium]|jgi:hypothetical protein|nr:hypothetical protein [Planctomycetota bacterium]
MRDLRRISYARLAEIVGERGGISTGAMNAARADAERGGALFPEALVRVGAITEWELMRIVAIEFGLPIVPVGTHDLDRELVRTFPPDLVARSLVVPLDRFQKILTVAMPVLSPAEVLEQFAGRSRCEIFPVVSSLEENRRVVETTMKLKRETSEDAGWERLFDDADAAVLREAKRRK